MTENQTFTPEIQAAISSLYQQGFEAGWNKGYTEGVEAARAQLLALPTTPPTAAIQQEATPSLSPSTPIEKLDFPVEVYNCLKREGLHTIGEVASRSARELLNIPNVGKGSVSKIEEKLKASGYTLRDS